MKSLVNISVAAAMLFALTTAACATDVFGDQYGQWNLAGSPYYVIGDVSVPQDSTLIINAGVEVLFWGYYKFSVQANATLQALGGPGLDSVRFTTPFTAAGWHGLRFFTASPACSLAYCVFEYGKATSGTGELLNGGAIYCSSTNLKISHSWIRTCTASNDGGAIYLTANSNATISDSTKISGNSAGGNGGGIYCGSSNPTISGGALSVNSAGGSGGAICCVSSNPEISGNTCSGNWANAHGGGIYCGSSNPTISGNTISNNYVTGGSSYGGGICCVSSSPTISGNTISNNSANIYDSRGGGIYCTSSSPTISGNTISNNSAHGWSNNSSGGGISCYSNSNPIISENALSGNSSELAGGIYCNSSSPTMSDNTITGNTAYVNGGGILCDNSSPSVSSNVIHSNFAQNGGGIFTTNNSHPDMDLNQISKNHATNGNGGGLYCSGYVNPLYQILNKNTFYGNTATGYGGGIYLTTSNVVLKNSIFWLNQDQSGTGSLAQIYLYTTSSAGVTYSDVKGGWPGMGNINLYPVFVDTSANDFHLQATSPCINTGDPDPIYNDPNGTRADMGCYYFPGLEPGITVVPTTLNFGGVSVGAQGNLPLAIANLGTANLIIYSITPNNPVFTTNFILADSLILPGDTLIVTVTFTPTQMVPYSGTLTILNNDQPTTVAMQGTGAGPVNVTMTPYSPPIIVPVGGGSFNFNIAVQNPTSTTQTFDLWTVIELPGMGQVPVLTISNLALLAGAGLNRDRTQFVPPQAPAGIYQYFGYVGDYPWVVDDYSYFTFTKLGSAVGGTLGSPADWPCTGEPFTAWEIALSVPEEYALQQNYPNPFNPSTVASFQLPVASRVSLRVYDTAGRLVTTLVDGWREAGSHEVTFDASGLPSGIYFCRLQAGEFAASRKMVLLK